MTDTLIWPYALPAEGAALGSSCAPHPPLHSGRYSLRGTFVTAWGGPGGHAGQFRNPDGVAVDASGDVFVSDRDNNRVQKFAANGRFLAAWGVRGTSAGDFSQPAGLTVDCRGDLLVADTNNSRVQVFTHVAPATTCIAPAAASADRVADAPRAHAARALRNPTPPEPRAAHQHTPANQRGRRGGDRRIAA